MKYIIRRASDWREMNPPVEGSIKETVSEYNEFGENELVERWTFEIDNLLDFVDKYGEIVLGKPGIVEIPYEVIIYDAYIE